jgi:Glycosyl transferase family 2
VKSTVAVFTVIFPSNKDYFEDFFGSLIQQTNQNFDVIIVNDGCINFELIKETYKKLNIIEVKYTDTPSKNREFGINYILKNNYDIIIFGDSDDYFETNRVEVCLDKLNKYDIVVNDLTLFSNKDILAKKYFSNRIKNNSVIKLDFIKDKNIFGFTNTAVKTNIMANITFDANLKIVDWYLFTRLLLQNRKALFTNETETFYRQYSRNTIGICKLTNESIAMGIEVKLNHSKLLQKENFQFHDLYKKMIQLQKKGNDKKYIEALKKQNIYNPIWWEEIRMIEE